MQALLRRYEDESGPGILPEDRAKADAALAAIASLVGTVRVTSGADGASVTVDGEPAGTTPLAAPVRLDLGKHTVTVSREGYAPFTATLDVAGGNELAVDAKLAPIAATASTAHLVVSSSADATVSFDGKVIAIGRLDGPVVPGTHSVRVTAPGKAAFEKDVELAPGDSRTMDVKLEDARHAPVWPWVVGGAAVAVAGAAVGGYFLFRSSSPGTLPAGTFGSGQVTFQGVRW